MHKPIKNVVREFNTVSLETAMAGNQALKLIILLATPVPLPRHSQPYSEEPATLSMGSSVNLIPAPDGVAARSVLCELSLSDRAHSDNTYRCTGF
jgi:hypothetical protein